MGFVFNNARSVGAAFLSSLKVSIHKGVYWGMSKISKVGEVFQKEGESNIERASWNPLPTMHLLILETFSDLEIMQIWSVNYICHSWYSTTPRLFLNKCRLLICTYLLPISQNFPYPHPSFHPYPPYPYIFATPTPIHILRSIYP